MAFHVKTFGVYIIVCSWGHWKGHAILFILVLLFLQFDFTKPMAYLNLVNIASTLLAGYGFMVTYKTTMDKIRVYRLAPKFIALKGTVLCLNLQSFVISFLGRSGLPYCLESMGSSVRASRESLFFTVSNVITHYNKVESTY